MAGTARYLVERGKYQRGEAWGHEVKLPAAHANLADNRTKRSYEKWHALGIVRVPRIVATYSVGRVLNAKTALSQLQGGIVWGVGMALFEESLLDPRYGRYANNNIAEYHVPVNADIGTLDVTFVEENDTIFNPLGARGIGEIGITGVPAAIANAVYHATGRRVRDLPITLDKLI